MKLRPLTGTITALATPFRSDQVAYDDLKKLVAYQIKGGINGLVPVGTTGESPTLTYEEHMDVIRYVIGEARGRVPVIAGTGSNSTREAVEFTKLSHDAGADAMLVVAPYYNKPSQEGLFLHFSQVAEVTDKPIILYSIPSRCGVEISVGVVERLRAKYSHVAWIKESGGSVDRVDQLKQALGQDIIVLCGDDSLTLPFMAVGAEGVISVVSNLLVREIGRMVQFALANDFAKARKIHRRLYPAFKTLFIEPNPVPIKMALVRAGVISSGEVRLPLCAMEPANVDTLEKVLAALDCSIGTMAFSILINGSRGRMGQAVVAAAAEMNISIAAAVDVGDDISAGLVPADVVVDFSSHLATRSLLEQAVAQRKPVVLGTTGHNPEEKKQLLSLAANVPCVWAGNFSVGVNVLFALTRQACAVLGTGFDAEVIEMHHRFKKDAPSGTAARLLEIILEERKLGASALRHGRAGITGERSATEVGVHALRGGDVVGDHTVIFAALGERVELTHKAGDRAIFARGALRAAQWVVGQKPGVYDMQDVLGLKE